MRRIGILGGTFNPVHRGHLIVAEAACEKFGLDRVIWVPTHVPPHKSHQRPLSFEHRLTMVKRAIAPYTHFQVSETEHERTGPSYAAETLLQLNASYPNDRRYWIMGADAFLALPRWHRLHEVATSCRWLIAPRSVEQDSDQRNRSNRLENLDPSLELGDRPESTESGQIERLCHRVAQSLKQQGITIDWTLIPMVPVEISSSLIRQLWGDRPSVRYWVPEHVRDYINERRLYQSGS